MTRKKRSQATTTPGVFRWFRNWIALKEGGFHHEWRICRVLANGQVEVYGPVLTLDADSRYLLHAIWGSEIQLPPEAALSSALSLTPNRNRQKRRNPQADNSLVEQTLQPGPKALAVAEGIVDAFIGTVPALADFYRDRPAERDAVIRQIAVAIQAAMG